MGLICLMIPERDRVYHVQQEMKTNRECISAGVGSLMVTFHPHMGSRKRRGSGAPR